MHGEQQCGQQRHLVQVVLLRPLPDEALRQAEHQIAVEEVDQQVGEVEAERAQAQRPVQRVAEFQQRADAVAEAGEPARPAVHAGLIDDDVVIVELERAG